jgi:ABC-type protease/lipase transport system fused ATPase/permease subunit
VSFRLEAGDQLAIVGPAASGKTTLSRVLLGILRPQAGVVRLDGVDVSKWNREQFGRYVGYLPQDVELFSGTVAENICRFSYCEDTEIIRAARIAGCHELILGFPNAYDTEIGEDGVMLSGGQRQQVGLARALFGRPKFVVLDEPNSNLDINGDNALRLALRRLKQAKVTTIIVTHRQSIIANVDKLLVMEAGAVKSFGPKERVLAELKGSPTRALAPAAPQRPAAAPEPPRPAPHKASGDDVEVREPA